MWTVLAVLFLGGCDDHLFPSHDRDGASDDTAVRSHPPTGTGSTAPTSDDFCAVQAIVAANCLACHGAAALGGLDLATDAHAAIVGVPAAIDPTWTLVVPGQPEVSLLVLKIAGTPPPGTGTEMPPGAGLDPDLVEIVRRWVADGATDHCGEPPDTGVPTGRYHPDGYADPGVHGFEAKHQVQACTGCHAADLTGDAGPSCDTCHAAGWRTDCVFCHGGAVDGTGSPPRHISGVDDGAGASFVPHTAHTADTALHVAFDCTLCHAKPTDVLSPGHLFVDDVTPGRADVTFGGLGTGAAWDGVGGCSNVYCHGTGQAPGAVDHLANVSTCHDCHPDLTTGRDSWRAMSGEHEDHVREGIACQECHGATTTDATTIADRTLHVNGLVDVELPVGQPIVSDGVTCSGRCHGEEHDAERW